jgi:hypothetical protein
MPPKKSQYVLNFLARTKQHGPGSVASTGNDMYALFGFMDDQSKVYKIFQRVRVVLRPLFQMARQLDEYLTAATQNSVHCSA